MKKPKHYVLWTCAIICLMVMVGDIIYGDYMGAFKEFVFATYMVLFILMLNRLYFQSQQTELWRNMTEQGIAIIEEQAKKMREMCEQIDTLEERLSTKD